MDGLDPYLLWLGIREPQRPPDHYRLLGVALFEANGDLIAQAAERQIARVRQFQYGPNMAMGQYLIGEIAAARLCLLTPPRKIAYDAWLRRELGLAAGPQRVGPLVAVPVEPQAADTHEESAAASWAVTILTFLLLVFIGASVLVLNRSRIRVETAQAPDAQWSSVRELDPHEVGGLAPRVVKAGEPITDSAKPSATTSAKATAAASVAQPAPPSSRVTPTTVKPSHAPSTAAATSSTRVPAARTPMPQPTASATPGTTASPTPAAAPSAASSSPPVARAAVPDEAAQKKALADIRNHLELEYSKAEKPDGRGSLATLLLKRAGETKDDLASQYVLLCEARDQAVELGDADLFLQVLTALAERFAIDEIGMRAEVLANALRRPRVSVAAAALAKLAMESVHDAVRADKYAEAEQLVETAKDLARRAKDTARLKEAVAFGRELENLKRQYALARKASNSLAANPDDPAANLVVGRYLCLVRGDWAVGRGYVEKSGDATLKQLAASEQNTPTTPVAMVALADSWWDASGLVEAEFQRLYRSRAAFWYRQSQPALTGFSSARVTRRLQEFGDSTGQRP